MNNRLVLGLIGSAILFIGVFMPALSLPVSSDVNYFQNGSGHGTALIALSVISITLVLIKQYRALALTGAASMVVLLHSLILFQQDMAALKSGMGDNLAGNLFKELVEAGLKSVHLQWGWAVLIIGSVLLTGTAFMKGK
jgi:hypothetical protein